MGKRVHTDIHVSTGLSPAAIRAGFTDLADYREWEKTQRSRAERCGHGRPDDLISSLLDSRARTRERHQRLPDVSNQPKEQ